MNGSFKSPVLSMGIHSVPIHMAYLYSRISQVRRFDLGERRWKPVVKKFCARPQWFLEIHTQSYRSICRRIYRIKFAFFKTNLRHLKELHWSKKHLIWYAFGPYKEVSLIYLLIFSNFSDVLKKKWEVGETCAASRGIFIFQFSSLFHTCYCNTPAIFKFSVPKQQTTLTTKYRNGSDLWLDDKNRKGDNLYLNSLLVSMVNRVSRMKYQCENTIESIKKWLLT